MEGGTIRTIAGACLAVLALTLAATGGAASVEGRLDRNDLACDGQASCFEIPSSRIFEVAAASMSTTSGTYWVACAKEGVATEAAGRFADDVCSGLMQALGKAKRLPVNQSLASAEFGAAADQGVRVSVIVRNASNASASLEYGALSDWAQGRQRRTAQLDVGVMDAKLSDRSAERLVAALVKLMKRK